MNRQPVTHRVQNRRGMTDNTPKDPAAGMSGRSDDASVGAAPDADPGTAKKAPRGADLARDALAAARQMNAAKKRGTPTSTWRTSGSARSLLRRRWSSAGPDTRDPLPFGSALQKLMKNVGGSVDLTKATLFANWSTMVGPAIAAHCQPTSFVDGELTLQCESTAWASQLRLMTPQLLKKLNEALGQGAVRWIKATGPSAPSWRFGPRHVSGRGPRDTYG